MKGVAESWAWFIKVRDDGKKLFVVEFAGESG